MGLPRRERDTLTHNIDYGQICIQRLVVVVRLKLAVALIPMARLNEVGFHGSTSGILAKRQSSYIISRKAV